MRRALLPTVLTAALLCAGAAPAAAAPPGDDAVAEAFAQTTRSTEWEQVQRIPLGFPTHHPQGFALVGDRIFMSSVEILEPTERFPQPVDGHDRTPGRGVGHVLVLDRAGNLLHDVVLGEDTIYHPGGIDFDGESVWVPVAEYRPNSRSIVYRLDPQTYEVHEAFRVDDHVGGVVRDRAGGAVHGVSWGSRTQYTWTAKGQEIGREDNPNHVLDIQDCDYAGARTQLCSGITGLPTADGGSYELGGLELRDLRDGRILHQVPFPHFSSAGHVVTRNPVALEVDGPTLRLFAAPDDGAEGAGTELLVYEAQVG
ncbi:DUF6454 family protein [Pseudonocardia nigra]|uniref:DUF6454 family protein n=1 Tax=Pseudonocardia nigra TaxID=1921578 RepID=UPI001C5D271A|nr:DUF6454 family protein [Pseudonocardia nigra]